MHQGHAFRVINFFLQACCLADFGCLAWRAQAFRHLSEKFCVGFARYLSLSKELSLIAEPHKHLTCPYDAGAETPHVFRWRDQHQRKSGSPHGGGGRQKTIVETKRWAYQYEGFPLATCRYGPNSRVRTERDFRHACVRAPGAPRDASAWICLAGAALTSY